MARDYREKTVDGCIFDITKPLPLRYIPQKCDVTIRWKCSICGRTEQYQERYCPSCGAKMESEE